MKKQIQKCACSAMAVCMVCAVAVNEPALYVAAKDAAKAVSIAATSSASSATGAGIVTNMITGVRYDVPPNEAIKIGVVFRKIL